MKHITNHILGLLLVGLFTIGCQEDDTPIVDTPVTETLPPVPAQATTPFAITDGSITKNGTDVFYKGVNALQTYGLTNHDLMVDWKVKISREFIGNMREQPIDGGAIFASDSVWYHPLQEIVTQNREHGIITILCPFGWVDAQGNRTLLTGLNPSQQPFYDDLKVQLAKIAAHFKDQPDVWLQVWNEPYHWNNENNYSHDLWLNDMSDLVDNLRWVDGFQNIIVVPGNEQGQSETSILEKGNTLRQGRYNLLFDLHAYEKWLENNTAAQVIGRIETLKQANFPFIFGEVGVQNVGEVMPVEPFLNALNDQEVSTLAWLWNQNSGDNNALLNDDGEPNARETNNFWGQKYKDFLAQ